MHLVWTNSIHVGALTWPRILFQRVYVCSFRSYCLAWSDHNGFPLCGFISYDDARFCYSTYLISLQLFWSVYNSIFKGLVSRSSVLRGIFLESEVFEVNPNQAVNMIKLFKARSRFSFAVLEMTHEWNISLVVWYSKWTHWTGLSMA